MSNETQISNAPFEESELENTLRDCQDEFEAVARGQMDANAWRGMSEAERSKRRREAADKAVRHFEEDGHFAGFLGYAQTVLHNFEERSIETATGAYKHLERIYAALETNWPRVEAEVKDGILHEPFIYVREQVSAAFKKLSEHMKIPVKQYTPKPFTPKKPGAVDGLVSGELHDLVDLVEEVLPEQPVVSGIAAAVGGNGNGNGSAAAQIPHQPDEYDVAIKVLQGLPYMPAKANKFEAQRKYLQDACFYDTPLVIGNGTPSQVSVDPTELLIRYAHFLLGDTFEDIVQQYERISDFLKLVPTKLKGLENHSNGKTDLTILSGLKSQLVEKSDALVNQFTDAQYFSVFTNTGQGEGQLGRYKRI